MAQKKIAGFLQIAVDFIFPERCILCGDLLTLNREGRAPLCTGCSSNFDPWRSRTCEICSQPLISENRTCMRCRERTYAFSSNYSLFVYRDMIKEIIYQYKFRANRRIAEFFALKTAGIFKERYSGSTLIPVPFRRSGKIKRGWDHVEEITKLLAKRYQIPVIYALSRIDSTPQKTLNYEKRMNNLQNKIFIKKDTKSLPASVVLFDDLFTTGATGHECSSVLKQNGVHSVDMLTIAID